MIRGEGYAIAAVACVIFILGCFGNATLIFLVVKHKQLKTMRNAFLSSIAVADLLVGVVCLPVFGVTYAYPTTWMFGVVMCKLYGCLTTVCPALSIFTLTFLSIECCINTYSKSCATGGLPRYGKVAILFLLWFVCLCLGLPNLIFANITSMKYGEQADICFQHPVNMQGSYTRIDELVRLLVLLIVPVFIIVVSFALIAFKVFSIGHRSTGAGGNVPSANLETQQAKEEHEFSQGAGPRTSAGSESRYIILIMTLSAAYTIFWIPFHVYMMWFFYDSGQYSNTWHVFRMFAMCLGFADCCVRPWFVFGLEKTFNYYFKKSLCCCGHRTGSNEMIPLKENSEQ